MMKLNNKNHLSSMMPAVGLVVWLVSGLGWGNSLLDKE